ncbi:unnamed protein product [Chrysoparadoxa australica]
MDWSHQGGGRGLRDPPVKLFPCINGRIVMARQEATPQMLDLLLSGDSRIADAIHIISSVEEGEKLSEVLCAACQQIDARQKDNPTAEEQEEATRCLIQLLQSNKRERRVRVSAAKSLSLLVREAVPGSSVPALANLAFKHFLQKEPDAVVSRHLHEMGALLAKPDRGQVAGANRNNSTSGEDKNQNPARPFKYLGYGMKFFNAWTSKRLSTFYYKREVSSLSLFARHLKWEQALMHRALKQSKYKKRDFMAALTQEEFNDVSKILQQHLASAKKGALALAREQREEAMASKARKAEQAASQAKSSAPDHQRAQEQKLQQGNIRQMPVRRDEERKAIATDTSPRLSGVVLAPAGSGHSSNHSVLAIANIPPAMTQASVLAALRPMGATAVLMVPPDDTWDAQDKMVYVSFRNPQDALLAGKRFHGQPISQRANESNRVMVARTPSMPTCNLRLEPSRVGKTAHEQDVHKALCQVLKEREAPQITFIKQSGHGLLGQFFGATVRFRDEVQAAQAMRALLRNSRDRVEGWVGDVPVRLSFAPTQAQQVQQQVQVQQSDASAAAAVAASRERELAMAQQSPQAGIKPTAGTPSSAASSAPSPAVPLAGNSGLSQLRSATSLIPVLLQEALSERLNCLRVLDVDSPELERSVIKACDRVGDFEVIGCCHLRELMDIRFKLPRDAVAALEEVERMQLVSSKDGVPCKVLLKPAKFNGGDYAPRKQRLAPPYYGGQQQQQQQLRPVQESRGAEAHAHPDPRRHQPIHAPIIPENEGQGQGRQEQWQRRPEAELLPPAERREERWLRGHEAQPSPAMLQGPGSTFPLARGQGRALGGFDRGSPGSSGGGQPRVGREGAGMGREGAGMGREGAMSSGDRWGGHLVRPGEGPRIQPGEGRDPNPRRSWGHERERERGREWEYREQDMAHPYYQGSRGPGPPPYRGGGRAPDDSLHERDHRGGHGMPLRDHSPRDQQWDRGGRGHDREREWRGKRQQREWDAAGPAGGRGFNSRKRERRDWERGQPHGQSQSYGGGGRGGGGRGGGFAGPGAGASPSGIAEGRGRDHPEQGHAQQQQRRQQQPAEGSDGDGGTGDKGGVRSDDIESAAPADKQAEDKRNGAADATTPTPDDEAELDFEVEDDVDVASKDSDSARPNHQEQTEEVVEEEDEEEEQVIKGDNDNQSISSDDRSERHSRRHLDEDEPHQAPQGQAGNDGGHNRATWQREHSGGDAPPRNHGKQGNQGMGPQGHDRSGRYQPQRGRTRTPRGHWVNRGGGNRGFNGNDNWGRRQRFPPQHNHQWQEQQHMQQHPGAGAAGEPGGHQGRYRERERDPRGGGDQGAARGGGDRTAGNN